MTYYNGCIENTLNTTGQDFIQWGGGGGGKERGEMWWGRGERVFRGANDQ